ncbi:sel1 repeat family protein [Roseibium sp. CAU 1637]|uniref:Sel1 repeat family protein n=1 Tax=Roseibium limicola TaxID=2816037 RepID=A0A939EPP7_9HYPH|nr:tetratricopeptide repeat protein [Roseibium limicola]MBO0346258.1 sel1 repeat family protein [Roseibium limicola]
MSAMRNAVSVSGVLLALLSPAYAFDGEPRPTVPIIPEHQAGKTDVSPLQALRNGARQYYSGDKAGALSSLQYAAENGEPRAAWKLGKMYETGDGVQEDDSKAFQYYSQVIRQHDVDRMDSPSVPYVSSAYVALGKFFMRGIDGVLPKNAQSAEKSFRYAAFNFGDSQAQYELGLMYQNHRNLDAVRWFNLAAIKGHIGAQARLGETLYEMAQSDRRRARGLMWMSIAQRQTHGGPDGWIDALHEAYFARASEDIRRQAKSLTDTWIRRNRPDLEAPISAQAATTAANE